MGKKSSQKKQRKLSKEEMIAQKKIRKDRRRKLLATVFSKERIVAAFILLIALVLAAAVAILIWIQMSKPKSISRYLPADTIVFGEIDANLEGQPWQNYYNLVDGAHELPSAGISTLPSIADLIKSINTTFNIDFTKDIYPWLNHRIGAALLADRRTAIFLEVKDETAALDFFRGHKLTGITEDLQAKDIDGITTYQYIASSSLTIVPLANYIVIASDETAAKEIIDATKYSATKQNSLYAQPSFQRANNAVPHDRFGFLYGRPSELFLLTQGNNPNNTDTLTNILQSAIAHNFTSEAMSIKILDDKFSLEHIALFSDTLRQAQRFIKLPEKYRGDLVDEFSDKTIFFIGGQNIGFIMSKLATLLATKDTPTVTIETYIRTQIAQQFHQKISYDQLNDLFSHEYAMGLDNGQWKIAIELSSKLSSETQEKLLKKIFATEKFFDTSFTVTIKNNIALITPVQAPVQQASTQNANPPQTPLPSLKNTPSFASYFAPQLASGDDIIYARPQEIMQQTPVLIPASLQLLASLKELSISSNAFEDGLKTVMLFSTR